MAETTLTLPQQQATTSANEVKVITYWGAVRAKLWRDKITMFAMLLGLFMITITLAAPWIAQHVTGFFFCTPATPDATGKGGMAIAADSSLSNHGPLGTGGRSQEEAGIVSRKSTRRVLA